MIVVDIETSGVDYTKNSILSIGAVDFSNPKNQFYEECRLRKGTAYDPESLEVNGFTAKEITNGKKESLRELVVNFLDWTEKYKGRDACWT